MELVIFVGLQASGKSTFYHTRFAATHVLVSKDRFRNNRKPERRQRQLITEALQEGRSVVVDNTNPSVVVRQPLIELGRSFGAEIVGYWFESRLEDCLARNRQRQGKECVPEVAIQVTRKNLERPSYEEGFEQLFEVRLREIFAFEVIALIRVHGGGR